MPEEPGTHYYTVRVPAIGNETTKANNAQSAAVKVLPSKKRILIACDHPSWEVAFWRRAFESDEHVETEVFVLRGGGDAQFKRFPADTASLANFNAIVLIHANTILTQATATAINQYFRNGGSVLWIVDENVASLDAIEPFLSIMPVSIKPGASFVLDEFVPIVSADGFSHSVMRIARQGEELSSSISNMPPLHGYLPTIPVSNASVLLEHPENGAPILAVMETSGGRSAIICGVPMWRWAMLPAGFGIGGQVFQNLARNLSKFLLTQEKIQKFVLKPGKEIYFSGEPITITASIRDESGNLLSGAQVSIRIIRAATAETLSVELSEIGNGIYETRLPSLSPGKFDIFGEAKSAGRTIGSAKSSMIVEEYQLELAKTNRDVVALKAIAELSGGAYFSQDSISGLSTSINLHKLQRSWTTEHELWNSIWILIIAVVALSSEWFLRKRANLL